MCRFIDTKISMTSQSGCYACDQEKKNMHTFSAMHGLRSPDSRFFFIVYQTKKHVIIGFMHHATVNCEVRGTQRLLESAVHVALRTSDLTMHGDIMLKSFNATQTFNGLFLICNRKTHGTSIFYHHVITLQVKNKQQHPPVHHAFWCQAGVSSYSSHHHEYVFGFQSIPIDSYHNMTNYPLSTEYRQHIDFLRGR